MMSLPHEKRQPQNGCRCPFLTIENCSLCRLVFQLLDKTGPPHQSLFAPVIYSLIIWGVIISAIRQKWPTTEKSWASGIFLSGCSSQNDSTSRRGSSFTTKKVLRFLEWACFLNWRPKKIWTPVDCVKGQTLIFLIQQFFNVKIHPEGSKDIPSPATPSKQ